MKLFDKVSIRKPKLNKFDLSHEKKLSMNMGNLVPCLLQEVVPGDKFRVNTEVLIRYAPLLAPMMSRHDCFIHYFFVPNRLIWTEWEDFITGGRDGTSAPVHPYIKIENSYKTVWDYSSLADYLGVPRVDPAVTVTNDLNLNALPFRAYQLVYDEYYRDQNVTSSVAINKASGQVTGVDRTVLVTLRKKAWQKDYYTSALPWAQRGGAVLLPMTATVTYKTVSDTVKNSGGVGTALAATNAGVGTYQLNIGNDPGRIENIQSISNATTTINDLRRNIRIQEWLEKNARGGARYIEQILAHFGIVSSDARLNRPEYLGGGKVPIVVSEVVSTFQENGGSIPQGNMAGHGLGVGQSYGFKKFFEEHGILLGIMSIIPRTEYVQGAHRMWRRSDKFDYFWPELANIGEQDVKVSEIWYNPGAVSTEKDETFGYQSRYAEYKYQQGTIHGQFKNTLNYWHSARVFAAKPVLNTAFIESDPTKRIFYVTDPAVDSIYVQMYNKVDALRPMPYFGTPTL